jgi:hypothetical protein
MLAPQLTRRRANSRSVRVSLVNSARLAIELRCGFGRKRCPDAPALRSGQSISSAHGGVRDHRAAGFAEHRAIDRAG